MSSPAARSPLASAWLFCASAFGIFAPHVSFAQSGSTPAFFRADRLYEACRQDSPTCTTYIMAVTDAAAVAGVSGVCIPAGISARQAILSFQGYAAQNPASLSGPAAQVVLLSLAVTFPCRAN
ncbi:hypothetical protein MVG78_06070 [Roseomonas gilardii subsp. gilardii]|uniref:Rap1a/Tai family immunity protein n=1 Tax=Roseomonas gilardii TaxID=257708 RepID=UPI001FF8D7DD|nr:Rap1a/Tai family immunity protein [Roseomonas gilardii]UPG73709.1 hypothetical protein MVG78_06070 [Roseomonas gilardii subsp. gilardii]